jgi:hypothetical protein
MSYQKYLYHIRQFHSFGFELFWWRYLTISGDTVYIVCDTVDRFEEYVDSSRSAAARED